MILIILNIFFCRNHNINNPKPITNLIKGFKDELKIKGSKAFIAFLKAENTFKN